MNVLFHPFALLAQKMVGEIFGTVMRKAICERHQACDLVGPGGTPKAEAATC
jgi:hypothetical protein